MQDVLSLWLWLSFSVNLNIPHPSSRSFRCVTTSPQAMPSCTTQPRLSVSFPFNGTTKGLNPGYLRRSDPSLIALSHDTVSQLHDSADTLTSQRYSCPLVRGNPHHEWIMCNQCPVAHLVLSNVSCTCESLYPERHYSAGCPSFGFFASCVWISQPAVLEKLLLMSVYSTKWIKMFCSWASKTRTWCTQKVFHKVTKRH